MIITVLLINMAETCLFSCFLSPNENWFWYFCITVRSRGCYRDTGRRAIPQMDGKGLLVRGFYRRRSDAIAKCALEAAKRRYRAFAVQHQGWCATGPRAHLTYRKYGRSNQCRNGKGGPWANDVYFVSGRFKKNEYHCFKLFLYMG